MEIWLKYVSLDPTTPEFYFTFGFNRENDTAEEVAYEMVRDYNFKKKYVKIIAE